MVGWILIRVLLAGALSAHAGRDVRADGNVIHVARFGGCRAELTSAAPTAPPPGVLESVYRQLRDIVAERNAGEAFVRRDSLGRVTRWFETAGSAFVQLTVSRDADGVARRITLISSKRVPLLDIATPAKVRELDRLLSERYRDDGEDRGEDLPLSGPAPYQI